MPSPPPACASKLGCPPPMIAPWRKHLPLAPELPRSPWLTGGALLLALLSYGFRAELWPNHPTARGLSLGLLPIVLVVGRLQLLPKCLQILKTQLRVLARKPYFDKMNKH